MPSLLGRTIALTESRRAVELATLVSNRGGRPYAAPAVREVIRRDRGPALAALERVVAGEVAAVIFMTGVGARALFALATEAGRREALLSALARLLVVPRGRKALAALREAGVTPGVVPAVPTSAGVLDALAAWDLSSRAVAIQLAGDENAVLVDGLRARGVEVVEVPLYEWTLPEDCRPLEQLVHDLPTGRVDAIAFTSAPQVRHLFLVAERAGLADTVAAALRDRVLTAVVGPVCGAALKERGVTPAVEAEKDTMGALIHAIAARLGQA